MTANARPRRSMLYMPGANTRALDKGRSIPADAIILDLEDAVSPDAKDQARQNVVDATNEGGYGKRELLLRTNGQIGRASCREGEQMSVGAVGCTTRNMNGGSV